MSRLTSAVAILNELRCAPATIQDIADELDMLEDTAGSTLRQLYKSGRVVRRRFYSQYTDHPRWMYMLPEHAPALNENQSNQKGK
ncbi:MAG: hypothetical protein L0G63_01080 [Psychrobacter sp.]|uniref:hypothetical protein n=1 Tax=Psychrobacter sp. TaxID=56811 RepID=UPI002649D9EB|nr:hypothetical protein [Psychrobacter sp.]MDN5619062.1 hypothetical protein [Psychrobacter sp.]